MILTHVKVLNKQQKICSMVGEGGNVALQVVVSVLAVAIANVILRQ